MTSAGQSTALDVRPLETADIPDLIALARQALPDTMASRLGNRFAARYFAALLAHDEIRVDGSLRDGQLVGFIIYTADVASALRSVFRKHAVPFTLALLPALLSPVRVAYVVRIAWAVLAGRGEDGDDVPAELLSIGLVRQVRGAELPEGRVAHDLVRNACEWLGSRGVPEVKVYCKPAEVEPVANRFVLKEGFVLRRKVRRFGIPANLYVRSLSKLAL